jgi:uncharacterized membrane protein
MSQKILIIFPSRDQLINTMAVIQQLDYISLNQAAIIAKADDGETTVYDDDISVEEGGLTGGTMGSLMTALGIAQMGAFLLPGVGPIIALGAGAVIGGLIGGATGGLTAGLLDFGFDNQQLEALAAGLQNGRTALVIEVDDRGAVMARLQPDLKDYTVEFMLPADS